MQYLTDSRVVIEAVMETLILFPYRAIIHHDSMHAPLPPPPSSAAYVFQSLALDSFNYD
jgi:hypothetical protein